MLTLAACPCQEPVARTVKQRAPREAIEDNQPLQRDFLERVIGEAE